MIEIKNLTKVYKSDEKKTCVAIDNVSLKFPSSGLIFIIGKSGSGKSTLLNMIGTLDDITKGDIIIDGSAFSTFDHVKFQEYRSSYLGFIFQDFLVLDEFTVRENVELALDISNYKDASIDATLNSVGLLEYADSFPTELSGGQKQRVAIARALVKNPKLLLCDEPTGNLDARTSAQILKILKEESKTKLVIVVSHNLVDAEEYADRIIELSEGKIVSDRSRNPDFVNSFSIHDSHVVLPHHKDLSFNDIKILNEIVQDKKIKVVQSRGGFFPTKEEELDLTQNEIKLTSSHISRRNSLKLSKHFFRKGKKGVIYTILITALFISLFYIFQVFNMFDGNNSIKYREDTTVNVIKLADETSKGTISTSLVLPIADEEIEKYYDAGYTGKVYKLYANNFAFGASYLSTRRFTRTSVLMNYNYATQTNGVLCCDLEFLTNLYGVDGKLEVLAGDLDKLGEGVIITDYVADILLSKHHFPAGDYANCLSIYTGLTSKTHRITKIGAVIKTNYKERYSDIFELETKAKASKMTSDQYIEKYCQDERFIEFLEEVQYYLSVSYTFDDTIFENIVTTNTNEYTYLPYFNYTKNGVTEYYDQLMTFVYKKSVEVSDDEIIMSVSNYNELFNTHYTSSTKNEFKPHKITISKYSDINGKGTLIYEKEFTIKELGSYSYVSKATFEEFLQLDYHVYGLYFDNVKKLNTISEVSSNQGIYLNTVDTSTVIVINTLLSVFKPFCLLILVILFIVCIFHIIAYGINSIKNNIYEVGVLKALGAKSFDIGKIFVLQIIMVGFLICIVSILGTYLTSSLADMLLVSSFEEFIGITIFNISIIDYRGAVVSIDLIAVLVLSIISSVIPLIYLHFIKPLNILKGKKK